MESTIEKKLPISLLVLLTVSAGVSVANLYYNQPLLERIGNAFHTSESLTGLVSTFTQAGYGCGLLFLSPLGDILPRKSMIIILCILSSGSLLCIGFSFHIGWLIAWSFVLGLTSIIPQVIIPFVTDICPPKDRSKIIGIIMGGLFFGILVSRVVSGLIAGWLGWNAIFWIGCVLMAILCVLLIFLMPDIRTNNPYNNANNTGSQSNMTIIQTTSSDPLPVNSEMSQTSSENNNNNNNSENEAIPKTSETNDQTTSEKSLNETLDNDSDNKQTIITVENGTNPNPEKTDHVEKNVEVGGAKESKSGSRVTRYFKLIGSLFILVKEQPILRQCAVIGFGNFAQFSVLWTTLSFRLSIAPYYYSTSTIGLFGLVGVAGVCSAPLTGLLTSRIGAYYVTIVAICFVIVSWFILLFAQNSLAGIILGIFLLDFGTQSTQVSNQTRYLVLVPNARARLNSVYMVVIFVGGAIGSELGAWAYNKWGWQGSSIMSFIFLGIELISLFSRIEPFTFVKKTSNAASVK